MNISEVILNRVLTVDLNELQELSRTTYKEAFAWGNTPKNMARYLATNFTIEKLKTELSNPESEFHFARIDQKPIGYLKINYGQAQTEPQKEPALEIERIYVLQEFHGKKVGQILFERAIQIAHVHQVNYLWLAVWEKNPRAIKFYENNGFTRFGVHHFVFGDEPQNDIMMKLNLAKVTRISKP